MLEERLTSFLFFWLIWVKSSSESRCLNLISEDGVETLEDPGGLGASLFLRLGCLSALLLLLGVLGVDGAGNLVDVLVAADDGRRVAEADLSALLAAETTAGGEGGTKLGGFSLSPAILPSDMSLRKLLKSSGCL